MKCPSCNSEWNSPLSALKQLAQCPFCGAKLYQSDSKQTLDTVLIRIKKEFGLESLKDKRKLISIFSDIAPELSKEKKLLSYFLDCGGNAILIDAITKSRDSAFIEKEKIVFRLTNDLFISKEAAEAVTQSFLNTLLESIEPSSVGIVVEPAVQRSYNRSISDAIESETHTPSEIDGTEKKATEAVELPKEKDIPYPVLSTLNEIVAHDSRSIYGREFYACFEKDFHSKYNSTIHAFAPDGFEANEIALLYFHSGGYKIASDGLLITNKRIISKGTWQRRSIYLSDTIEFYADREWVSLSYRMGNDVGNADAFITGTNRAAQAYCKVFNKLLQTIKTQYEEKPTYNAASEPLDNSPNNRSLPFITNSDQFSSRLYIDLVFCVDLTPVMPGLVSLVKQQIKALPQKIVEECLNKGQEKPRIRVRLIVFKDCHRDSDSIRMTDFYEWPKEKAGFEVILNSLEVDGASTYRSGLEALMYAISSNWEERKPNRQVVVIWAKGETRQIGVGYDAARNMPRSFFQLSKCWGENSEREARMDPNAKRLVLLVPAESEWNKISMNWKNTLHIPGRAGEGIQTDSKQFEQIASFIVKD